MSASTLIVSHFNHVFMQFQAPPAVEVDVNDQEQAEILDVPLSHPNNFDPDCVLKDAM